MKKVIFALLFLSLFFSDAAWAMDWDTFVAQSETRTKIKSEGNAVLAQISTQKMTSDVFELWKLSCYSDNTELRAAASVKLINMWFPKGNPELWREITGFFPNNSRIPLQLAAINALFNAVEALSKLENGKFAAAHLIMQFGKSSAGKLYFIDNMPQEFRAVLDKLIVETAMPGNWESSKLEGKMPFLPTFDGVRSFDYAVSKNLQFFDGAGGIAENGSYAWDRRCGKFYEIVDPNRIERVKTF